jgi:hypothetical protein
MFILLSFLNVVQNESGTSKAISWSLQDKQNIRTLSVNIKFGYSRWETDQENSPDARLLFFLLMNFTFSDNVGILC